ncbi:hypothetical protein LJC23_01290 [Desulfovibrio sp. OttesenSCG-928-I05]|nr:hypothetical protein [Desulfovibrio sp. OttesenSCG-928-I05]
MIKIKFLSFSTSVSWEKIEKSFLSLRYTDNESQGVNVSSINDKELKATFYEKITYTEIINHPIDGISEAIGTTYFASEFVINREKNLIYFINSTKRVNSLLTFLSLKEQNFYASDITLNVLNFPAIGSKLLERFRVKKLTFPPFELSEHSRAFFSIASKSDVFNDLNSIALPLPKKPTRLAFEGILYGRRVSGELLSTGMCSVTNQNYEVFLEALVDSSNIFERQ